ncbi:MAG TPA: AAA family ATPase [Caulobacteraceae bacterium]
MTDFPFKHIHVVGASGSGTTTLAVALAERIGARHLDTDSFYWLPTSPPFQDKRPVADRLALMRTAFAESGERWVLSGSLLTWGIGLASEFDLVVFLYVPPDVRMARTLARERERYCDNILPGGEMHKSHLAFLDWSRSYDRPDGPGRSLANHKAWLATLTCPVLEIAGAQTARETLETVLAYRG